MRLPLRYPILDGDPDHGRQWPPVPLSLTLNRLPHCGRQPQRNRPLHHFTLMLLHAVSIRPHPPIGQQCCPKV
jgi:hypothetical protein